MQSVSSRIWTRVAVFISYDDNHYTTGTSKIQEVICDNSVKCKYSFNVEKQFYFK